MTKDSVLIQIPEGASFSIRTLAFDQISNLIPIKKLPGTAGLQTHAWIRQSLVAIPIGSKLNLGMPGGISLSGRLLRMASNSFSMQTLEWAIGWTRVSRSIKLAELIGPPQGSKL